MAALCAWQAALVTVAALVGDGLPADDRRMFAIGILCLLLSPILITLPLFNGCDSKHSASGSIQESLLNPSASTENDDSAEDEKRRVAAETAMLPTDNTIQMISGLDCWLLWIGVAALAGGGQLVSANVNQMCESLGALLQLAGREREREREALYTNDLPSLRFRPCC